MTTQSPYGFIQIGFGTDLHRIIRGYGVTIGGVFIPCEYGVEAVSDGDVLIHALVDALLGASGQGDIGEHFPASEVEAGAASGPMLQKVAAMVRAKGAGLINVDCIIDCDVIRLAQWKNPIKDAIAELLQIQPHRVNIKAKTAEGLGPVGEGRAVAAQAVVLLSFSEGY